MEEEKKKLSHESLLDYRVMASPRYMPLAAILITICLGTCAIRNTIVSRCEKKLRDINIGVSDIFS